MKFLPYPDTTSILLIGIDSQVLLFIGIFWYVFQSGGIIFFSKSKGKILDDFAFLLHFERFWLFSL